MNWVLGSGERRGREGEREREREREMERERKLEGGRVVGTVTIGRDAILFSVEIYRIIKPMLFHVTLLLFKSGHPSLAMLWENRNRKQTKPWLVNM